MKPIALTTWIALLSVLALGCSEPPRSEVAEEQVVDDRAPAPPVEAKAEAEPVAEAPVEPARPPRVPKPVRTEPAAPAKEQPVAPRASAPEPKEVPAPAPAPAPPPEPEIIELEVAAGTILELELLTAIDSSVNRAGDEIQARTLTPLYVSGEVALPAGAHVQGRVTEVEAAGRVKGRARLAFTFDRLRTPNRLEKIRTSFVAQEAESGKKKDAAVIGGAAGVGAVVGGIIGGKKGAAIGGAVGGAGGTGVVLTTKGEEIRLPVGTTVNVRLDDSFVIQKN